MTGRGGRLRIAVVLLLLLSLHFVLQPYFWDPRGAPDLILLALLVYAIRSQPGNAAVAGFVVGVAVDSLNPAPFGAGALAHTAVGYLAAWGKAVFFAENLLVNAGFFFLGTWVRDLLVLVTGGHLQGALFWQMVAFWSPIKALTTSVLGVGVLIVFSRWLRIRITG